MVWIAMFEAGASPAQNAMVSRRSQYTSAQPPSIALSSTAATESFLSRRIGDLRQVEHVAGERRRHVGERAALPLGQVGTAEQDQVGVIAGNRVVGRHAQRIARTRRLHQ